MYPDGNMIAKTDKMSITGSVLKSSFKDLELDQNQTDKDWWKTGLQSQVSVIWKLTSLRFSKYLKKRRLVFHQSQFDMQKMWTGYRFQ